MPCKSVFIYFDQTKLKVFCNFVLGFDILAATEIPFHGQNVSIERHAFATLQNRVGVVMEVHEYDNAYYQVKDDVLTSLPAESEEEESEA